jgi:hypothetical protein
MERITFVNREIPAFISDSEDDFKRALCSLQNTTKNLQRKMPTLKSEVGLKAFK